MAKEIVKFWKGSEADYKALVEAGQIDNGKRYIVQGPSGMYHEFMGTEVIGCETTKEISSASTHEEVPSAKAVYEAFEDTEKVIATSLVDLENRKENISNKVTEVTSDSSDVDYPSAKAVYTIINDNIELVENMLNAIDERLDDLEDNKENKANKVTEITSGSTDTQYPSAKAVYDLVGDIDFSAFEEKDNKVTEITSGSTDEQYPSAKAVYEAFGETEEIIAASLVNLDERKENITNKVTEITSGSTDEQYPSAKAVYDLVGDIDFSAFEEKDNKVTELTSGSTDEQYPSAKAVYDVIIQDEKIISSALNNLKSDKEDASNKVTEITSVSTDEQYPSAKAVYDLVGGIDFSAFEEKDNKVTELSSACTDTQYPSAKAVYDVIHDDEEIVTTGLVDLNKRIGELDNAKANKIPIITSSGYEQTVEIEPEKFYQFGEVSQLTITLAEFEDDFYHEYMFEFRCGNVAANLELPAGILGLSTLSIEPLMVYQISIMNNIAVVYSAALEAE